ncbi:MAG: histidine phosphatase family protein [Anaerolineae bacterium]|nr:histidine phosphatase family protein [Anaerolineae bacterium]
MPVRVIYLVRHGQYESYPENGDALGGSLTPLGRDQAEHAAEALSQMPISAIHTSTLRRAAETAALIAGRFPGLTVQASRELWEIIPCIPPREAEYFALHFPALTPEAIARDREVADTAFERLFRPPVEQDEQEVIVCHGNLIRYYVCRVLEVPVETWGNMETNNCGITRCTVESDGRKMLISMNDVGHLTPVMRTFT